MKTMCESLSNAAKQIQEISKDWPEKRHRCGQVLEALLQLTIDDPEKAKEGFTNIEIHEFVSGKISAWGSSTDDEVTRKVREAWKNLGELWIKKERGVVQRFKSLGLVEIPMIHKVAGGGGGIVNKYSLKLEPAKDGQKQSKTPEALCADNLEYFEDDVDNLRSITKLFSSGFLLSGWKKWLFFFVILIGMFFFIALLLLFAIGINQQETVGATLKFISSIAIILWAEWLLLGAFFKVVDRRVEIAPWWLQPWTSDGDWLLVFEKNKPAAPNVIKLKRYTAQCSRCGGLVRIQKGGFVYYNRLVGRCDSSPREHVFSFDHYLRVGKELVSRET